MLKIIGILILISAGAMGGYSASIKLSQKVRFIEEYMEFIKIIQNEIRYNGNYLSEIINKHRGNGIFYSYLDTCYRCIMESKPFPVAWNLTFNNISSEMSISSELANIINNFGLKLGSTDIDGQISYCQYNYEIVLPYLKSAMEEKKTLGKLYSVLGICIAAGAALFFV